MTKHGGGGTVHMTTESLYKTLQSLPNVEIVECRIKLSTGVVISLEKEGGAK